MKKNILISLLVGLCAIGPLETAWGVGNDRPQHQDATDRFHKLARFVASERPFPVLSRDELMLTDGDQNTLLHYAAHNDHLFMAVGLIHTVPELLKATHQDGSTPLHAAARNGHVALAELLIRTAPELVKVAYGDGFTVLHYTVGHGHVPLAELLLKAAPELLKTVDIHGWIPLHVAAAVAHRGMADLLLAQDQTPTESINRLNNDDESPLIILFRHQDLTANAPWIRAWIQRGGNLDVLNPEHTSFFHRNFDQKNIPVLRALVDFGANPDCPLDAHGTTPLMRALQQDNQADALMLLSLGARVDLSDTTGKTVLAHAPENLQEQWTALFKTHQKIWAATPFSPREWTEIWSGQQAEEDMLCPLSMVPMRIPVCLPLQNQAENEPQKTDSIDYDCLLAWFSKKQSFEWPLDRRILSLGDLVVDTVLMDRMTAHIGRFNP